MKVLLASVLTVAFAAMGFAGDRNPVGEVADYILVKDRARTSSLIKSGTFHTEVLAEVETGFDLKLDYDITVLFQGRQQGTQNLEAPKEYFEEGFLDDLATRGTYETEQFKVRHLGFGDVSTVGGGQYENCHKLHIYDIKMESAHPLVAPLVAQIKARLAAKGDPQPNLAEIEDIELFVWVKPGIPVLGAVRLDMTAKYSGMGIKAGADYVEP